MAIKGPDRQGQPRGEQTANWRGLDRGLGQVDQVATSVFEENSDDGAYVFWFAAEGDAEGFETVVLGVDVVCDEGRGRNAGGEKGSLVGLSWREGHGLEDELDALGAFGSGDGQPSECGTHGDVFVFHEAQDGGVEVESVVLIFNHYAGESDLHGPSSVVLCGEPVLGDRVYLDHEGCNFLEREPMK